MPKDDVWLTGGGIDPIHLWLLYICSPGGEYEENNNQLATTEVFRNGNWHRGSWLPTSVDSHCMAMVVREHKKQEKLIPYRL